jgi:predicted nuclease of predicted toxin-antitoxin system
MKIIIDMNLSPEWVSLLTQAGYQALHWTQVGNPKAKDSEIMAWAVNNGYIVFTHDLDFGILLAMTQANSPSVIQVRTQNVFPDEMGKLILNALKQFESELTTGALVTINQAKTRANILPLR